MIPSGGVDCGRRPTHPTTANYDPLVTTDDGQARIEQILSGHVATPADYLESTHEWVTILAGGATIEVEGERIELAPGDWVLLPADVPHRLTSVDQGTSWLAFHFDPS